MYLNSSISELLKYSNQPVYLQPCQCYSFYPCWYLIWALSKTQDLYLHGFRHCTDSTGLCSVDKYVNDQVQVFLLKWYIQNIKHRNYGKRYLSVSITKNKFNPSAGNKAVISASIYNYVLMELIGLIPIFGNSFTPKPTALCEVQAVNTTCYWKTTGTSSDVTYLP